MKSNITFNVNDYVAADIPYVLESDAINMLRKVWGMLSCSSLAQHLYKWTGLQNQPVSV